MIIMLQQDFIKLEARLFNVLKDKDPEIVWKAIDCGSAYRIRLYAESQNYNVSFEQLLSLLWLDLCLNMKGAEGCYVN